MNRKMDLPKTSMNTSLNKHSLESLSKDELLQKVRNLLTVAQKARATKDSLQEEVEILKSNKDRSAIEIVESFSKQKLDFVSAIDALKTDKTHLLASNNALKEEVDHLNKHNSRLENETLSFKRQFTRMSDENGQLLTHLDDLEKQNIHLNKIGLEQRQQLLRLEQSNLNQNVQLNLDGNLEELQKMFTIGLDEMKKLKCENDNLNAEIEKLSVENNANPSLKKNLETSKHLINNLDAQLIDFWNFLDNLKLSCQEKHSRDQVTELKVVIAQNKKEIDAKSKELESIAIAADDLNTELHKNKALVEVLQGEIRNTNFKLSDNQIVCSGITSDLENENEKLKEKNKLYHGKIVKCATEIRKLRIDKENVLLAFKAYNGNVKTWKDKLETLANFLSTETTKNDSVFQELKSLNEKYNCHISELSNQNAFLQHYMDISKENASDSISHDRIIGLINANDKMKATIFAHKEVLKLSNSLKLTTSCGLSNISEEDFNNLKRENSELLTELNLMNQSLKERGESISQHQTEYENLLKKQQQNEIELNKLVLTNSEKDQIIFSLQHNTSSSGNGLEGGTSEIELINDKTKEIKALQEEVNTLKDMLKADVSREYTENETMSTSTISRTEDLGRFKDLDTSWEDRYSRLRSLALKQKARIRDLTAKLTEAELINSNISLELSNSTRQVQTLQEVVNKIKEESTQYRKKLDIIAQDISRDKIALSTNDEIINAQKNDMEQMLKDKAKTELWKKQVSVKVQSLKKELEANNILRRDFEIKLADLNAKVEQKDGQLRDEINRHVETKNRLQEFTNECKKQSVLNLEMQDYERSGKELNQRLEKRTEEYKKLQEHVNTLNDASTMQCEQIQVLEAQLSKLDSEVIAGRQEVTNMQKKCTSLETALSEKEISVIDMMGSYEEAKRENEDLNIQLSKAMTDRLKSLETSRCERDALQLQVLGLEQRLTEIEETMRLRDMELSNVKSEYDCYKVRAQSVLRQNNSRDIGIEEKLSEEADSLRTCVHIMQRECEELRISLSEFKTSNDNLIMQKLILDNKIADMQHKMDDEIEKYNVLSKQYDVALLEHSESTKIFKAQSDTLAHCYRTKLNELESRHSQEILQLQAHVDQSNVFHSNNMVEHLPTLGMSIMPPPMAREAAEGSESVENVNSTYKNTLGLQVGISQHPLEQLLELESNDIDVPGLRRQIIGQESKVTHLTELLADTEQDLAKHVQMNLMLKEEIRRQQRSVEREKHADNLEYMKNIIVKFITLNNGDERQRLVPVLNTILRLSPDEMQKISAIAKGDRGWSNYLPTWPKPQ